MNFLSFFSESPAIAACFVFCLPVISYAAYSSYIKLNSPQLCTLLGLSLVALAFLATRAHQGYLKEERVKTVVVMPDKRNLRLGENGELSFCVNGLARDWVSNENGIVSTRQRLYLGRPMRCLSIQESIAFLRNQGATDLQLKQFSSAYN